jgi:hypothetical protein
VARSFLDSASWEATPDPDPEPAADPDAEAGMDPDPAADARRGRVKDMDARRFVTFRVSSVRLKKLSPHLLLLK